MFPPFPVYSNRNLSIFVVNQQTDEKYKCLLFTLILFLVAIKRNF